MRYSSTSLAQLFGSMALSMAITIDASNGIVCGVVQMIEAEDGSGNSWNVRVRTVTGLKTVYVRTK